MSNTDDLFIVAPGIDEARNENFVLRVDKLAEKWTGQSFLVYQPFQGAATARTNPADGTVTIPLCFLSKKMDSI